MKVTKQQVKNIIKEELKKLLLATDELRGPQVMKSGAGWYVGYEYYDDEYDFWGPYDRVTGYYATKEEAEEVLAKILEDEEEVDTRSSVPDESGKYLGSKDDTLH